MTVIHRLFSFIRKLNTKSFWCGWAIGTLYFAYIFSWFWSLYPLAALGIPSRLISFFLIFIAFSLSALCMGFFSGIFAFATERVIRKTSSLLLPFCIASFFVIAQYAQAWAFGIFWLGKNTLIGPHWTLGNPAYFFANIPFVIKTAALWGIYGIDFLLALIVSGAALYMWRRTFKKAFFVALAGAVIGIAGGNLLSNQPISQETKINVALIQTQNPVKSTYTSAEILSDLTAKSNLLKEAAQHSDLVVFPERSWFSQTISQLLDLENVQKFFSKLSDKSVLIVDNNRVNDGSTLKSEVFLIDSKEGIAGTYDKKLLTPGGEFLPYIIRFFVALYTHSLGISVTEFSSGSGSNLIGYNHQQIELLVCSDIISPTISNTGASNYIIALNSMGLFGQSRQISDQFLAMARFRASESRKYLALASNDGYSYIINPQGKIEEKTSFLGYQILTGAIAPNSVITWYNNHGDWPVLALSAMFVIVGMFSFKCRKKSVSFSSL